MTCPPKVGNDGSNKPVVLIDLEAWNNSGALPKPGTFGSIKLIHWLIELDKDWILLL